MITKMYIYRNRTVTYMINESNYSIIINNINVECTLETTPFKDVDLETACQLHIDKICDELDEEERKQNIHSTQPTQEEIQAEILLNQAEILTNQNSQDEVLAELLLNSLEVQ